ncbi:MAG: hypothetical protein RI842_01465 [Schleiferiaceae bacterium]|nr:hypothetical protein [Schleiferiaceae bacterium]MDR9441359.1 hypothetical protein [Schleiferiaceae bacterium]
MSDYNHFYQGHGQPKIKEKAFLPYRPPYCAPLSMRERARGFSSAMEHRRSCRYFAFVPVNRQVIEEVLATATTPCPPA